MKNQKGITLIALIITIIVMLILVGVSVSVALNGGLFETAKKAVAKTETAKKDELIAGTMLTEYCLAKANGETTATSMQDYVLEKSGVQIGHKVNYEEGTVPTSGMEWRVLGVNDKGEIELISTKPTEETVELYGRDGYLNAITLLDTTCSAYGQGEGVSGARALTAEDINKLAGYNPATDYDEYGTKYTYKYYNGSVYGIPTASITDTNKDNVTGWTDVGVTDFYTPDYTINSTNIRAEELQSTYYNYVVADELQETTPDDVSWAIIITNGEGGTSNVSQWLASRVVGCNESVADFNVQFVNDGIVYGYYLYVCANLERGNSFAVRPVVSLKSNVKLIPVDNNKDGVADYYDI